MPIQFLNANNAVRLRVKATATSRRGKRTGLHDLNSVGAIQLIQSKSNQSHFSSLLITVQFNENDRLMYSGRVRTSGSEGNHNRLGALSRLLLCERPTSSPS